MNGQTSSGRPFRRRACTRPRSRRRCAAEPQRWWGAARASRRPDAGRWRCVPMAPLLSPDRDAAQWWRQPGAWAVRWQLEAESMRRDPTIAPLTIPVMRRMPDVDAYTERHGLYSWDLLAYSANVESADGRLRLVAAFRGDPYTTHPDMLCL